MLPSLTHFIIAIIGAGLAVGLFTFLNEKRTKEGKKNANPTTQLIIIIVIIILFIGYLFS
jgi:hypothetical protein